MSRIGNAIIELPANTEVSITDSGMVTVKGPKGELKQQIDPDLSLEIEDGQIAVKRPTDQIRHKAMHGLYRSLIANMVTGVTNGFTRELLLEGVGFRVNNKGQLLEMSVGYSHPIMFFVPPEVKLTTQMEKGSPPKIILEGIDKQLVGQIAAKIRAFRKPEPYKGKGIRYSDEIIRRKAGKTAG